MIVFKLKLYKKKNVFKNVYALIGEITSFGVFVNWSPNG